MNLPHKINTFYSNKLPIKYNISLPYIIAAAKLFTVQNRIKNIAGPTRPIVVISRRTLNTDHLRSISLSA